jgi:hypothetical protein
MALINDKLIFTHGDADSVYNRLADELAATSPSFITVFYGEDTGEDDAQAMSERLRRRCCGAEVNVVNGGQPVYRYLISAE